LFIIYPRRNGIKLLWLGLGCLIVLLAYLLWERISLDAYRRRIPLRVAVAGTRGKSSVARLIAAGLRGSGRRVVARTTGSRPVVILPDGSEREIERPGPPSVLEGKKLLRLARDLQADTLVVELMSISPEYLAVESGRLFKPSILAVTNVRLDHPEAMGRTKEEIAGSLAAAIPRRATVFIPGGEWRPVFRHRAAVALARLVKVRPPQKKRECSAPQARRLCDFPENMALALTVTQACGVREAAARRAMAQASSDRGALRAWKIRIGRGPGLWTCVSAFAANEPESTFVILAKLKKAGFLKTRPRLALLNLRADRPDRSQQWLAAVRQGFFKDFDRLIFNGAPRAWFHRMSARQGGKPELSAVPARKAEKVMDNLLGQEKRGGLLVGFGNFGGMGQDLVEFWEQRGKACG